MNTKRFKKLKNQFWTTPLQNQLQRFRNQLLFSSTGCQILKAERILREPGQYWRRRKLYHHFKHSPTAFSINSPKGYGLITPGTLPGLESVLNQCETIWNQKQACFYETRQQLGGKKRFFTEILSDEELVEYPELVEFALSPSVLAAVTKYLGTFPLLRRVGLYVSSVPDDPNSAIYSQFFHYDHGDLKQLKFFINVFDVTPEQGPFTFLTADWSKRIEPQLHQAVKTGKIHQPEIGRYTDEAIEMFCPQKEWVVGTGQRGTGLAVDTSRCYHFGSRVQSGFRLCFFMNFLSYHYVAETQANCFDIPHFSGNPYGKIALTPPIPVQKGYYFPKIFASEEAPEEVMA